MYADWLQAQNRPQGELITVMDELERRSGVELELREAELQRDPGLWPRALRVVTATPEEIPILPTGSRMCDRLCVEWELGLARSMWVPSSFDLEGARAAIEAHGWSLKQLVMGPLHLALLDIQLPCLEELVIDFCAHTSRLPEELADNFKVKRIRVQGVPVVTRSLARRLSEMRAHSVYLDVYSDAVEAAAVLRANQIALFTGSGSPLVGPAPRIDSALTHPERLAHRLAHHIGLHYWERHLFPSGPPGGDTEQSIQFLQRQRAGRVRWYVPHIPPADGNLHGGQLLAFYVDQCTNDGILHEYAPRVYDPGDTPFPNYWVDQIHSRPEIGRVTICWIPPERVEAVDEGLPALAIEYASWVDRSDPMAASALPEWLLDFV